MMHGMSTELDQDLLEMFIEMMKTIAEYVQNAESLTLLGHLGVDLVQGYFIGRPTKRPAQKSTPISLDTRRERALNIRNILS